MKINVLRTAVTVTDTLTKASPKTLVAQFDPLLTQVCTKILVADPISIFSPTSPAALLLHRKMF